MPLPRQNIAKKYNVLCGTSQGTFTKEAPSPHEDYEVIIQMGGGVTEIAGIQTLWEEEYDFSFS